MNHPSEHELILHHYGEAPDRTEVARHLEVCESCRSNYQALQRVWSAVDAVPVPERSESYGAEVWGRLRPRLPQPGQSNTVPSLIQDLAARVMTFRLPRWAVACGLALAVGAAFLGGRFWPQLDSGTRFGMTRSSAHISTQARERILLKEIGDHLERSQLALIELINSQTNGLVDISLEQALARQLVDVNRLYRQTASRLGDTGMASVLEDLERTLIEISNSPAKLSAGEFADFRRRIDTDDMLFKVKVVSSQVRAKEREAARELAGKRS